MDIRKLTLASALVVATLMIDGCENGGPQKSSSSSPATPQQWTPQITSISPTRATAKGSDFQLTVNGSDFHAPYPDEGRAVIYFGELALTTTLVNNQKLTATVPAQSIAIPGAVQITVGYTDFSSNPMNFQILPGVDSPAVAPAVESLGPAGTRQFTVSGFSDDTFVTWSVLEGDSGGVITATGLYTAPVSTGTFHVIATGTADPTQKAASTVTVTGSGFTRAGAMNAPRAGHTATLLADGKVLVVGGQDARAELFDPETQSFSFTGSLSAGRSYATATLLKDGRVLVAGGLGLTSGPDGFLLELNSAEIFDPETGMFSAAGHMASARWHHTATLLSDGKVLIAGGYGTNGPSCATASAELFDPSTRTFSPAGFMLSARVFHTAVLLNTGQVLVAGGANGCAPDSPDDPPWDPLFVELFDPSSQGFKGGGEMSTTRIRHSASHLPDDTVLLLGGIPALQNLHQQPMNPIYAELFDPKTSSMSPLPDISFQQDSFSATLLQNSLILEAGGETDNVPVSAAELLDAKNKSAIATGSLFTARTGHTSTLLKDGRVLITGGTDGSGHPLSSAEIYK